MILVSYEIQVSRQLVTYLAILVLVLGVFGVYALTLGTGTSVASVSSAPTATQPSNPQAQPSGIPSQPSIPTVQPTAPAVQPTAPAGTTSPQDIYIRAKADGTYDKRSITVKSGIPVRLHFTADSNAGCGRQFVLYGLNVKAVSIGGVEQVVEFTPTTAGTYEYNCGMKMWQRGSLIIQ